VNYANYVEAKARLLKMAQQAFINGEDGSATEVRRHLSGKTHVVDYMKLPLSKTLRSAMTKRFPESYNQANARLVAAMAHALDVSDRVLAKAIARFTGVPGRMQYIGEKNGVHAWVDFAHTPNAFQNVLTAMQAKLRATTLSQKAKKTRPPRLIAVFGSAGLRDRRKRPVMGRIASELADYVVLTAEDPRTEDVWSIIRQLKESMRTTHAKVLSVPDRFQAIKTAITQLARRGDHIIVLGKGHEQSMCFGTTEFPWSDASAIQQVFAKWSRA
jgi:UDP-N-acetylmuramoyl-L-alanyl-D-glutamate--2,6-diaminopimelate ligase